MESPICEKDCKKDIVNEVEEAAKKWALSVADEKDPMFEKLVEAFKAGWGERGKI